jgi:NAD(P)-dependent dehydrogenase (short-subunit alcohol dehydrogenase family)
MILGGSRRHSGVTRKTTLTQETTDMLLENKIAVIHGAGGDIGAAVAQAFAREGAKLFLSGRNLPTVQAIAAKITERGGYAEAAQLDALDEPAVEEYLGDIAEKAERIDISFNAISVAKELTRKGPLLELSAEHFSLPISAYTRANFITARAAARHMVRRRSGVILTISGTPGRMGFANVGGSGPAYAAVVALTRSLSVELGPQGVRAVGLMPNAIPESSTIRESFASYARALGVTHAEFQAQLENMTHLRRLTTLEDLANAAAFAASERGRAMTGTVLNLSGGGVVD